VRQALGLGRLVALLVPVIGLGLLLGGMILVALMVSSTELTLSTILERFGIALGL